MHGILFAIGVALFLGLSAAFHVGIPLAIAALVGLAIIAATGRSARFGKKKFALTAIFLILVPLAAVLYERNQTAVNPDLNHTHADFAVWIGGKQLDFSGAKYMTTESREAKLPPGDPERYLHLHDGNGHVIHRHKPGLRLGDFFASIGFSVASGKQGEWCWYAVKADRPFDGCLSGPIKLYVNGKAYVDSKGNGPFEYVFQDGDHLLIADAVDPSEVQHELSTMTDDACKYSKTCPGRGPAPAESCISDPAAPCRIVP